MSEADRDPQGRVDAGAGGGGRRPAWTGRAWRAAGQSAACLRVALVSGTLALVGAGVAAGLVFVGVLLVLRSVDPPGSMLMLSHRLEGRGVIQSWVPLERISPNLIRAVITSEDGQFCRHHGVDFKELAAAMDKAERGEEVRGASTISMQVTKNMFLWPERSYVRKVLEIGMALVMERIWPKPRILEIYLNIAEWGPGVFGAEAAARHHFGKPAMRLSEREAALLASALPSPLERAAGRPGTQHLRLAAVVERRMRAFGQRGACLNR